MHWTALATTLGLFLSVLVWQGSLIAQVTTGTISGAVKDPSGAVLPGATVTATNVETGITRNTTSGGRGEYRLPALGVGTYDVQAEMAGFQTSVRKGITLNVGSDAVVEFALAVGEVTTVVDVTGEAALVEATTATVSGVVDSQQMRDIPLNSRSFLELVPLQTGAVFAEAGDQASPTWGFGKKLAVVGTRFNANSFLLDGADINNVGNVAGSAAGTMAGVETVREFRVITNAYDAEYGRHSGAVISAVTKSGTNDFHGSVFEFLRNDNLDAPRWEDNKFQEGEKPEFKRNQFGGSLGGPVLRDRTFFFGSYEGLRQSKGRTDVFNVPGIEARAGRLNGAPVANLSPVTMPYVQAYPLPNVIQANGTLDRADGRGQFAKASNEVIDEDFFTAKVDHRLSDEDSFFARINTDDASQSTPGMSTEEILSNESRFYTVEETHIFSPTLLGKTHFSFNRTRLDSADVTIDDYQYPNDFVSFDGGETPGRITVTNLTAIGGGSTNPKHYVQNVFQFKQDVYYSRGRHSFKMGGQFERFQLNDISGFFDGGSFAYTGLQHLMTNAVVSGGVTTPGPGTANFTKPGSDNVRGSRQNLLGLYLQDDISVRSSLTINMGLRWEIINSPIEVNGKMANIRDLTSPHIDQVAEATVDIGEPYFVNPSLKNFAPRIGLAWDPFGSGKTSVRAGVGFYHDQILPGEYRSPLGRSQPFYAAVGLTSADFASVGGISFPRAYFVQSDRLSSGGGRPQFDGIEWNIDQPAVYKWSFDVQRELLGGIAVEAGYSGTRSTHLLRSEIMFNTSPSVFINGNRFIVLDLGTTAATSNPLGIRNVLNNQNMDRMRWRTSDATSDYHGLRLSVSKRFSQGFQFQTSYTFSKATDDSSNFVGSGDFGSSNRNAYRMDKEHGPTAFDVRQSFTANAVIDLPGRNLTGAAGKLLGGWSLSTIARFNSGNPVSLTAEQARIGSSQMLFVGGPTLDLIPGGDQNPINPQNPDNYYDVSQFAFPAANCITTAAGTPVQAAGCDRSASGPFRGLGGQLQGNVGRNHVTVPGVGNVDITLMKETALPMMGEAGALEFRWELFNLFNRPNFGNPGLQVFTRTGVPNLDAGLITSTRDSVPSRQMQFALKVVF
jgi:hypothetical protein